ncbi:c-type cytochrome [Modicisalibacter luteus]|uniref:C-type cytochrome n=1 Tax=Modicisalibacter luteus TaxID=453962 RepID=A0ABV7M3P2_9GAMM|nr:cytochrome c [Halomonas lutea]
MRILLGAMLALLLLALSGVAYIYSGAYNVAASDAHTPWVEWAFHETMHNSVEEHAEGINVPDLDDDQLIAKGARAYQQMCVSCHLRPGLENTILRQGLNPKPPVLAEEGHWAPAEQFWIVKHGIKMSSMPAWGETHDDQALWEIVAFLQRLPGLSEPQYLALISSGDGSTAQDDGHDHSHGDMSAMMEEPSQGHHAQGEGAHGDGAQPGHHEGTDEPETASPPSGAQPSTQQEPTSSAQEDDHYADGHTH